MYDRELVSEVLNQIKHSADLVLKRFEPIKAASDFTDSEVGMEKLDAICMQLIAIGEGLKNIDKITDNSLLPRYSHIEWKKVKGMRDIISHHYFDIDADAIFEVCRNYIKELSDTIGKIIEELE